MRQNLIAEYGKSQRHVLVTSLGESLVSSADRVVLSATAKRDHSVVIREASTGQTFALENGTESPILDGSAGIYVLKDTSEGEVRVALTEYAFTGYVEEGSGRHVPANLVRADPLTGSLKARNASGAYVGAGEKSRILKVGAKGEIASGAVYSNLSAGTFSGSGGSGALDSAVGAYGNTPAILTVDAGNIANYAQAVDTSMNGAFIDDGSSFTVVAEIVSGMNTNNTIKLIFSSDAAVTKTMTYTYTINKDRGNLIFMRAKFDANEFIGAGGESFTNTMNYMAVKVDSAGGTTGGVIKIHGIWKGQRQRPSVILQFDDAWLTQYTSVFQYMASRGLVGDVGVARDYVGGTKMSVAQMQEMYDAGWNMVVHGVKNHNDASLGTSALLRAEIADNQAFALENGWTRGAYDYIYPGGIVNHTTDSKAQLQALGIRSARLTTSGQIHTTGWGTDDTFALNGRDLSGSYSAASDLTLLDRAIGNGSSVIFYGHKIVRVTPAANEMTFAEFMTLIDGISDRVRDGKVDCITQSKFIDTYA